VRQFDPLAYTKTQRRTARLKNSELAFFGACFQNLPTDTLRNGHSDKALVAAL